MTKDGNFKRKVRNSARAEGKRYTETLSESQEKRSLDLRSRLATIETTNWHALTTLRHEAEASLPQHGRLDADFAQELARLLFHLGDYDAATALLERLLKQPLDLETQATLRYNCVDYRACGLLTKPDDPRNEDAVRGHREFITWGRAHLPPDRWLWIIGDSTMYVPWEVSGRTDEWLSHVQSALKEIPHTASNRFDRFDAHRTCFMIHINANRLSEAEECIARMAALADEDPAWEHAVTVIAEALRSEVTLKGQAGDSLGVLNTARRASELTEREISQRGRTEELVGAFQQIGCRLFWLGHYHEAIDEFRRYISHDGHDHWMYLCLAGATWVTTRDRARTLEYLRESSKLARGGDVTDQFRQMAELADLVDDPEFLAAAVSAASASQ